jgi:hypothetical protein
MQGSIWDPDEYAGQMRAEKTRHHGWMLFSIPIARSIFSFHFNTPTAKNTSIQTRTFLTPTFPQIAGSLYVVASGMFC